MHRNQQQNRNLEPFTVRAGSETGLYYILVANLAHRTTWRELKAFASQACEVDHAEVYPPTSGFVRVKGRTNFEKAFKYLDGNTLEYRALQADARNLNQSTVVKLPPTDYHAARIVRGDEGRVFGEPEGPVADPSEPFPQGVGGVTGSPYLDYHASASPAFNMADAQWSYVTSSSYAVGGYQPAPPATMTSSGSAAYQAVTASNQGFLTQAAVNPPPAAYHTIMSAASTAQATATQYQYSDPAMYYPAGAAYETGGPGYASFAQPAGRSSSHAYVAAGYDWPPDAIQPPTAQHPDQLPNNSNNDNSGSGRPAIVIEKRKIIIRDLERDGLSAAVVTGLLVQHAGIGAVPGQIETLDLPFNKDGRARGTAYVTFSGAELANAAVAALDGQRVGGGSGGGKKLSARLVVEGVSPEGSDSAARPGRRLTASGGGGGGGGGGKAGSNSKGEVAGKPSRSAPSPSLAEPLPHPRRAGPSSASVETLLPQSVASPPPFLAGSGEKKKEERPVIVDGSGGRWKKEAAPVVVDGSAGKRKGGGHRSSRH